MKRCIVLGAFALGVFGLFFTFAEGWNGQSRWALSAAIARRGTTAVDEFIGSSRDVCVSGGHLYAAKAPGIGILGAPLLWWADRLLPATTFKVEAIKRLFLRVVLVSVPGALTAVVLCAMGAPSAALGAVALCLGSPSLPYATLLYGHVPAGLCLLATWRLSRARRWLLAGLVAGIGVLIDYLTFVGVAMLIVITMIEHPRGALRMVAGMVPAGIVLGGYNMVSFGTVFATGYESLADQEFTEVMSQGVHGIGVPRPRNLIPLLFGPYRGLVLHSPWLILWPVGAWRLRHSWKDLFVVAGVPAVYVVLLTGFPVWWGGASCGVRHAIVALPLVACAVATLDGPWRVALIGLGVASTIVQFAFTITEPEMPEDVAFPLRDFVMPHLLHGRFRATVLGCDGYGQWIAVGVGAVLCAMAWVVAWRRGCCMQRGRVS